MSVSSKTDRPAGKVPQNDPSELLEVFDAQGRPTGRARSRQAIHLDGDWHQAFHCWVLRTGTSGLEVVLQQRSAHKDTFPSRWDASAAGHWRFGESAEQAAREIEEELGIHVPFERLRWVGRERSARHFHANGLIDREHHQVYALDDFQTPLGSYRPDPREVAGLAAVPAHGLIELAAGRRERLLGSDAVRVEASGEVRPAVVELTREDLVPYSAARLRRLLVRNVQPRPVVGKGESFH